MTHPERTITTSTGVVLDPDAGWARHLNTKRYAAFVATHPDGRKFYVLVCRETGQVVCEDTSYEAVADWLRFEEISRRLYPEQWADA